MTTFFFWQISCIYAYLWNYSLDLVGFLAEFETYGIEKYLCTLLHSNFPHMQFSLHVDAQLMDCRKIPIFAYFGAFLRILNL